MSFIVVVGGGGGGGGGGVVVVVVVGVLQFVTIGLHQICNSVHSNVTTTIQPFCPTT